jgi:hypothetical protein
MVYFSMPANQTARHCFPDTETSISFKIEGNMEKSGNKILYRQHDVWTAEIFVFPRIKRTVIRISQQKQPELLMNK